MDHPEPRLTAIVYNQGHHDRLLHEVIRPFWEETPLRDRGGFLWTMRFGARGEHLKLRLHGPDGWDDEARTHLGSALDRFVSDLPEPGTPDPGSFPPVDQEDASEGFGGRTWLFTDYRPSPYIFGTEELAADATFRAHFARTQAAVTQIVLGLASAHDESGFEGRRQSRFTLLVADALSALRLDREELLAYTTYHRDWLLRHLLVKTHRSEDEADSILSMFESKLARSTSAIANLRKRLFTSDESDNSFSTHCRELFEYAQTYRSLPPHAFDPYAENNAYLPLFKTLHHTANQFGLAIGKEFYTYQLLLAAQEPAGTAS